MAELLGIDLNSWPIWANGLLVFGAVLLTAFGARWVVDGASALGKRLGISELVLGLTVVALGTSAPEFAVTLTAAFQGQGDISVSNVIGSNIFNLGFILGGCALVTALPTQREMVFRDGIVLFGGTLLLYALVGFDLTLDRFDGIVFFSILIIYLVTLIWIGQRNREAVIVEAVDGEPLKHWGFEVMMLLFGLGLVIGGSKFLVDGATVVARAYGMTDWEIGVTVVAAGTSAPELATSLAAALKGRFGLGVGALIGSDIFNLFGVLGLAGIVQPVAIGATAQSSMLAFILMVAIVLVVMRSGWRISRGEGMILLVIGAVRWGLDLSSSGG